MSVIIILIIISVIVALFFLGVFIWAVKTGQFDDTVSPAIRILFDDKKVIKTSKEEKKNDGTEKSEGH
jgi:cbb3-type cytochrome oxidase maturation protein